MPLLRGLLLKDDKFLNALQGKNQGSPPVWLMRQAGRYLPEYQALRAKHSLKELFFTPKLAAEITLMPIKRFGFDAAILFSDITSIAPALGFELSFHEGPVVKPVAEPKNWQSLQIDLAALEPIAEAIHLIKQKSTVPLIGFCGGPFTVATYLAPDWKSWEPVAFQAFLDHICEMCIVSLQQQISAGVDAVQIFDSWANLLQGELFQRYSLDLLKRIINAVNMPVIVFMRDAALRVPELSALKPTAISVDWGKPISDIRRQESIVLQGNLNPELLFRPIEEVRRVTRALLDEMPNDPAFIVNLGHGILPKTPLEAVSAMISEIRS